MVGGGVSLALVASLSVCFAVRVHRWLVEAEDFDFQGECSPSRMISYGAFVRFGHGKMRFLAVDTLQEYFGRGPSVELSI